MANAKLAGAVVAVVIPVASDLSRGFQKRPSRVAFSAPDFSTSGKKAKADVKQEAVEQVPASVVGSLAMPVEDGIGGDGASVELFAEEFGYEGENCT